MNNRDLEFLYELGTLRNMPRGWIQHLVTNCASNLEHTMRVVFLALMIARKEGAGDEATIIKMALIHDLPESRTSDLSYVQKVYVQAHEERAAEDMLAGTVLEDWIEVFRAYERRDSIEAKIVKDADNLDIDVELKELEEYGHQLPAKWSVVRRKVKEEKFYTETAKRMWDEVQISDPSSWHLHANKWYKLPDAGK